MSGYGYGYAAYRYGYGSYGYESYGYGAYGSGGGYTSYPGAYNETYVYLSGPGASLYNVEYRGSTTLINSCCTSR